MATLFLCAFAFGDPPPCTYSDETVDLCGPDIDHTSPVTCRMIGTVPGGVASGPASTCQYYYCDQNVVCPADHTKFLRKLRTKTYYFNSVWTNCSNGNMVTSTHDVDVDCCFCMMPDPPSFIGPND